MKGHVLEHYPELIPDVYDQRSAEWHSEADKLASTLSKQQVPERLVQNIQLRKQTAALMHMMMVEIWSVRLSEYHKKAALLQIQKDEKIIPVHGTLGRVECEFCKAEMPFTKFQDKLENIFQK